LHNPENPKKNKKTRKEKIAFKKKKNLVAWVWVISCVRPGHKKKGGGGGGGEQEQPTGTDHTTGGERGANAPNFSREGKKKGDAQVM